MKTEKKDLFEETFDSLWKIENYNFGTTDEDGYHNFDDYTEYPFAIDEMSILAEEYQKLKQQLQSNKEKEDKLREYIKHNVGLNMNDMEYVKKQLLEILNEGDK